MIQIIKQGTRKTCTCKGCGCLFSYEGEDIKYDETGYHGGGCAYVKCPQCNNEVYLTITR